MHLTPLRLAAYALPAIPIAALGQPFYMFAPTFYSREVGLAAGVVGAILLAVRVVDALADLVAGRLSDLTPGRFGRRKPWVLLASPLAALSAFMVLSPPEGAGAGHFAFWTLLVSVAWACIILPLNAWGAELSSDYKGRVAVTAWREAATLAGVMLAVVVVAALSRGGDLRAGLSVLGLFVAVSAPLACGLCAWILPDPPPRQREEASMKDGLRAAMANAPFRRLVVAYLVNGIANGLPATLFLFFVGEQLGRPDLQGPLLGAYFLAGLASAPIWAWAGGRFGKHVAWCAAMVWACAVFALALTVNGPEDWGVFLAICVGSGLALGADVVLPAAMQADVVDLDELETGKAPRTGLYFALWSVATKLALAVSAGVAFGALGLSGFDTSGAGQGQSPLASGTLVGLYCALPIVLKLWAIMLMARFPITADEQRRVRALIEARAAGPIA